MTMNKGFVDGVVRDIRVLGEKIAELEETNKQLDGANNFLRAENKRLRDDRKELWQFVKPVEGALISYVGVHTTRWCNEWGEPTAGFVRAALEDDEE